MKIAIVGNPYYPIPPTKYGGTERVINYLIKGLKEKGHEPILLAPGDSTIDCEVIPIVKKSMPFPKRDSVYFRTRQALALQRTKAALEKIAPYVDIIHSHDFDLKNFQKYPNVTTLHGHIDFTNYNFYKERKDLPFVSISKNQQATFPSMNFVGVAYNGLDPSLFPLVAKPKDYICFIGRFDFDKSPHLAIQLAIAMGIKIKLAGKLDLEGYDYFRQYVKPHLKNPLVEYLGEVSAEDGIKLVSQAKCNIHPLLGRREPFGLTVIESAYCGTPTMAINRASMPELIEDRKTGFLVEDFVEGYNYMDELFSLDRQYVADWSRKKFNYKNMTNDYIKAYRKVIKDYKNN
jgi:glycosyltransferase involved in cell wall biosynthesis